MSHPYHGLNELRELFLQFFETKGHLRLPSFSLVPQNDKSILLINAGMTPMKPWFKGEEEPPRRRVCTCQKCIRTGDIENVGKTARHGTTFNAPAGDYAIWTYSSPEMTFDGCTFHSSGKTINVYTDYGAGKNDITVNFKNCTVVSEKDVKCVMNINDSNMGNFKYRINIEGKNTVTGITPDNKDKKNGEKAEKDTSCSKLFEFKNATNNSGRTIVSIDGKVVWQDGEKTGHAIDTANDKYTDGYKDDAFDVTVTMPWKEQADGSFLRKVRKVCQYCGFSEEVEERKQPESTPSFTEPEAYPDYSETIAPTPTPVPAPDSDVAPKTGGNDGAAWVLALLAAGTAAFAMRKRARG